MNFENRALIIVDVQPTFCEGGALGVTGGNETARKIADFVTENADEYAFIVTTQDWHINPGAHFSDSPDYKDTWPVHGVAGTPEAELHDEIAALPFDDSVKKGQYSAAYSGFEGINENGETLEEILRAKNIQAIDVVGIAESHCVKDTALDALRAGWQVRVFSDLTVPVSEELGVIARNQMDEAGIEQINTKDAFGFYREEEDAPIPGEDSSIQSSGNKVASGFSFGRPDSWGSDNSDNDDDAWDSFSDSSAQDYDDRCAHWGTEDSWNGDDAAWDDSDSDWDDASQDHYYTNGFNSPEDEADQPTIDSVEAEIAAAAGKDFTRQTAAAFSEKDLQTQPVAKSGTGKSGSQNTGSENHDLLQEDDSVFFNGNASFAFADFDDINFDFDDSDPDLDAEIDFSDEVSDEDFDFSNIDFRFEK